MKKILILLITFYSFSFSATPVDGLTCTDVSVISNTRHTYKGANFHCTSGGGWGSSNGVTTYNWNEYQWENGICYWVGNGSTTYSNCSTATNPDDGGFCQGQQYVTTTSGVLSECFEDTQTYEPVILPDNADGIDENGIPICISGYSNLVVNDTNTCAETPSNSNGFNPDGSPSCLDDYVDDNGICIPKPDCNTPALACASSCYYGVKTFLCTDGAIVNPCECNAPPPASINDDGSETVSQSNGDTTTTYPDGSTITKDGSGNTLSSTPATNGTGSGSTGGTSGGGTNGVGGQSGATGSGGTGETSDGSGDTNDLTPPSVASSCSDTNMTLEQKMLCELNEGMKNQNSESDPSNSLNNLIKDLVANNTKDNKAINDNIKDLKTNSTITNSRLTAVNSNLSAIKTVNQQIVANGNTSNSFLDTISTGVTAIGDFLTTVTDLISDPSKIGDKLDAQLSALPSKFAQSFVSDNCQNIQTISINYHGTEVEFLSQSLIDTYFPIEIMRVIIILTFAMAGFMNFFRSAS